MQTQTAQHQAKRISWKTILWSGWVRAFVLPFLIVGIPLGYEFGHHQYKDIMVIHPGQFQNYSHEDAVRNAWENALLFGLIGGIPAGLIGVGGYGCFVLCRKLVPRKR